MQIRFAKKEFSYYWPIIRAPLAVLVLWSIASLVIAKVDIGLWKTIFTTWSGILVQIAVFAYAGYVAADDHKADAKQAAWSGALVGVIGGFIGGILGLIMLFLAPGVFDAYITDAVAKGAPEEMVRSMTRIGVYAGIITGPLFGGLFAALIAWIAGAITCKCKK